MKKSLILAAVTALSLSAGAAMAQESPSGGVPDYQAGKTLEWLSRHAAPQTANGDISRSFVVHSNPVQDTPSLPGLAGGGE